MSYSVTVVNINTRQSYEMSSWWEGREFVRKMLGTELLDGAPVDILGWAHYPDGWRMSHAENKIGPTDWKG